MESAPSNVQRSFSKSSSGPSGTPRASTCPAISGLGNHASPRRDSPVVNSQSSAKTSCIWVTTGPRTRKWMSCTGLLGWRRRQCPTRIFMPPVKPMRPSVTRIFRCVRMFIAIKCQSANEGRNRACLHPFLAQGVENGGPGISRARRVNQHADLHAPAGGVAQRPREGQPDFVPVEDIGAERDGLAGLLNRLQHRGERLISANERLDSVARQ